MEKVKLITHDILSYLIPAVHKYADKKQKAPAVVGAF